jgi:hypothetical protein
VNLPKPASEKNSSLLCRSTSALLGAVTMIAACPDSASAAEAAAAPPPQSRVNALVNFEFSDKYLTPRGMIVHDDGLTFQPLVLGFFNIYKGDKFLNDFTLVGGVWNDFSSKGVSEHPPFGTKPKTHWVEIDPIAGISTKFAKNFQLDVTYTVFEMNILDIPTSQHLETKLSFDDTPYLKKFALHPYFLFWKELEGKATAAQVPYAVFLGQDGPDSSHYFEFGITPGYTFEKSGLKLEAPMRVLLPDDDFYGEYYDDASFVGLYEVGVKATIPIKCFPKGYGNWSVHAGFRYMGFEDDNLRGMQEFNAPGKAKSGSSQVYGGISIFF